MSGSDPIPLPPLDPDLTILFYSLSMKVSFSYALLFPTSFERASQFCRPDRQLASNHLLRLMLLFFSLFPFEFLHSTFISYQFYDVWRYLGRAAGGPTSHL